MLPPLRAAFSFLRVSTIKHTHCSIVVLCHPFQIRIEVLRLQGYTEE